MENERGKEFSQSHKSYSQAWLACSNGNKTYHLEKMENEPPKADGARCY